MIHKSKKIFACGGPFSLLHSELFVNRFCFTNSNPNLIPKSNHMYNTHSLKDVATLCSRTDIFKYLFCPSTMSEWNNLDLKIWQSETLLTFWNALIKIGRPIPRPLYNVHKPFGLILLTRLRLGFSHLNQHKFSHILLNPLCSCSLEVESVSHFFSALSL